MHYPVRESVEVEGNEDNARRFLEGEVGKEYDLSAIIALPFRKSWQRGDKWFCSELVAEALIRAGHKEFRIPSSRVTPRDLWVAL
jgi:hypothetical protein